MLFFNCCHLHPPAGGNDEWVHDDSPVRCLTSDAHFDGRDGQSLTPELTWPAAAEASPLQIGSLSQDWLLGAVAIGRSGRDAADLMQQRIDHR